jgi:long-subunit fatty acid transport protein
MTNRLLLSLCVMLLVTVPAFSQDGLALMKVEAGARQAGMAGAGVSIADEPNAGYYNPAAAADADKVSLSFGHNSYWENIRIETGYFVGRLNDRMGIQGGIRYGAVDDIETRLIPSTEPEALFSAYDISFKGGIAYRFTEQLSFGAALGWYIEKIDIYRGSAFNVDLGWLYHASPRMNLGASVTNLGSTLSLATSGKEGSDNISLPTTYRFGGSYKYERYLGAVDAVIVDDEFHLHLSAEADLHESFAVRAGYMFNYDTKNITAGASFKHRNVSVDYAFVPYSDNLGTSHLFNLTFTL